MPFGWPVFLRAPHKSDTHPARGLPPPRSALLPFSRVLPPIKAVFRKTAPLKSSLPVVSPPIRPAFAHPACSWCSHPCFAGSGPVRGLPLRRYSLSLTSTTCCRLAGSWPLPAGPSPRAVGIHAAFSRGIQSARRPCLAKLCSPLSSDRTRPACFPLATRVIVASCRSPSRPRAALRFNSRPLRPPTILWKPHVYRCPLPVQDATSPSKSPKTPIDTITPPRV